MKTYRTILFFVLILLPLVSVFSQEKKCDEPNSITKVKRTASRGYEYLIFEVRKAGPDSPFDGEKYDVSEGNPPFTDYSGEETIPVAGDRFRHVVFYSVNLFKDQYPCDIDLSHFRPGKLVKDAKLLYAFEGVADFAVGFDRGSRLVSSYSYDAGNFTKIVLKFGKAKR